MGKINQYRRASVIARDKGSRPGFR